MGLDGVFGDYESCQGGGALPATEADRAALDREAKRKKMFPNKVSSTVSACCNYDLHMSAWPRFARA